MRTDGRSLWSETYDRELKDVFAVQNEIATCGSGSNEGKVVRRAIRVDCRRRSSENPAAHNAVLQSDFYFQQQTADSVRKSISFLQEAVRLDPNYALAYAKLSQAWRQYAASFAIEDASKAYDEARQAADKAVSLAPDLVDVRMTVGLLAMNPGLDFPAAEKEFRQVLQSSPNNAAAKNGLALSLLAQGRFTEAEEACRQALLLDPLLTNLWFNLGRITVGTGRYKEAGEAFRKGLELQPNASRFHTYLATLDVLQNRPAQATANAQLENEGFWRDYAVALVQQAQGDRSAADASAQGFYRQGFERRRISDRCALRNSQGARPNVQVARYCLCHARFRPDPARRYTLLPPLSRRPAFHRVVSEAQRASALKPDEVMNEPNFFAELKRRNVYKVAVAYAVVAWLLMQVASQIFPFFEIPNWVVRLVVVLLVIGFPIALIIAWAFEVTPEGIKRTEAADAAGQRSRGGAWIYVVLIGAALSVGLFFVGRYTAGHATARPASEELRRGEQSEVTTAGPDKSIAVLPLINESGDPKDEYFSDGLSEELIAALAQISGLKVIGRSSSFRFKDRKEEPRAIGEKLGVSTLLDGTVRKQGDRVRIVAELVNAADGIQLWTRTFDRELKDIFAVQEEIAQGSR